MKITTKQLVQTALLVTICIISQYFRQLGQYVTGSIVNTTIILAVLAAGLYSGLLISIVAPVTAFLISPSPIISAIPLMFPVIMMGNSILAATVWFFQRKLSFKNRLPAGLCAASLLKSAFLGICVVLLILPLLGGGLPDKAIESAKIAFSLTQLITALTGSLFAFLIWLPLRKYLRYER